MFLRGASNELETQRYIFFFADHLFVACSAGVLELAIVCSLPSWNSPPWRSIDQDALARQNTPALQATFLRCPGLAKASSRVAFGVEF